MREVELVFADSSSLVAFVLREQIRGLDVKTFELKVIGLLNDEQILIACSKYGAVLQKVEKGFCR